MHVASTRLPSLRAGDMVGDYCIEELDVGHSKENPSLVRLTVGAPTPEQLQAILVRLEQLGGRVPETH